MRAECQAWSDDHRDFRSDLQNGVNRQPFCLMLACSDAGAGVMSFGLSREKRVILGRVLLGIALVVVLGIASLIGFVASQDLNAMRTDLIVRLQAETGGRLQIAQSKALYWPRPRVVLDGVSFTLADGSASLAAPRVILGFDLLDIIDGRIDAPVVALESPEIRVAAGPLARFHQSPRSITDIVDAISGAFSTQRQISGLRLTVSRGRLVAENGLAPGTDFLFDPLQLRLKYSARRGRIDVSARRMSEIRPIEMTFSLPTRDQIENRKRAPASLVLSGFGSRASFVGHVSRAPDLALSGAVETSIQDAFERVIGIAPFEKQSRDDTPLMVKATLTLDPRGGGLEGLRISRGTGVLTGIASLRENGGRWSISSTLAGDLVDGTATYAALQRLRKNDGTWSDKAMDVNPAPGLDLDIRLSTRAFKLGKITLENAALSVFTRAGRAEFTVADARYGAGTIKARIAVIERQGEHDHKRQQGQTQQERTQDLRMQVSGDKIDTESFLDGAFGLSRLKGIGHFAFQTESHGATIADLVANLSGAGTASVRNGEITGIDLNRLMTRSAEMRPEAALIVSLGGRSTFETFNTNLAIQNGKLEPVGSTLMTSRVEGMLEGAIDLAKQRHQLAVILKRRQDQPGIPSDFFAFRIDGPLFSPNLKPDLSLIPKRN